MKLKFLINQIKKQILSSISLSRIFLDTDIKGLSINSKLTKEGFLFFCLKGNRFNGADFIKEAYQNGARIVILEDKIKEELPKDLAIIQVKDIISCLGELANKFYNFPSNKIDMTAITGTNGKTTTAFIIEDILKAYDKGVGVVGTINYRFGKSEISASNTTPDILTIHNILSKMLKDNNKYFVMEVSSHALEQRRIEGLKFNQAIFTNLAQDHFDYHKTKQNYFMAKAKLFTPLEAGRQRRPTVAFGNLPLTGCTDYLKDDGVAIINVDDNYGLKLVSLLKKYKNKKILTYGIKRKADVSADNIEFNNDNCSFVVKGFKKSFKVETNLIGDFNVYNVLAGICACLVMKIPVKYIQNGLKNIYIPGRLEKIPSNHNIKIFVDYAHTEEALRSVLTALKKIKGNSRLIALFGCGGDRDKDKRPKMGRAASELADFVILTSDNPRSEDPAQIISEISKGIRKNNFMSLVDRREAIKKAIDITNNGDILVVAGKGHEDYQIVKDKKFSFSDRAVIEEILQQKEKAQCLN